VNFYHTWIYQHILNAPWFVWTIVVIILGLNLLFPVLVWGIMSGVPIIKLRKKKKKGNTA